MSLWVRESCRWASLPKWLPDGDGGTPKSKPLLALDGLADWYPLLKRGDVGVPGTAWLGAAPARATSGTWGWRDPGRESSGCWKGLPDDPGGE